MSIEIVANILTVCSAIIGISTVANLVISIGHKAGEPNKRQDERLDAIDIKLKSDWDRMEALSARIERLEQGSEITAYAILGLLRHAIDGDDIEGMKKARDEMERFLTKHN